MPASPLSLPEPKEAAGTFLFDAETIKSLTNEEEKHGIYTAARCPKQTRENIIELLAEMRPVHFIARICRVHTETVTAVADSFSAEISDLRSRLARKLRRISVNQADRLEKYPEALPMSSVPLSIKLLVETAELLEGKATSRVEVIERVDVFSDFQAFLARLEMETKNGPPEMGCGGGKSAAIAGQLEESTADPGSHVVLDCESSVSEGITLAKPDDVTGYVTGPSLEIDTPGSLANPPGGGSAAPGPRDDAIDNASQNFWPNGSFTEEVDE